MVAEEKKLATGIQHVNSRDLYPHLHQAHDEGLPLLLMENTQCRLVLALQGAQILAFQPTGQDEMLWLSPRCVFAEGTPIRGGIPLCLPWFGPHPDSGAMHGFARAVEWTLRAADVLPNGATRLVLGLTNSMPVCLEWPYAHVFTLEVIAGQELQLNMTVHNACEQEAPLAFAFHTYFAVPDVAQTQLSGLGGKTYIDKTDNFARKTQVGDVRINERTDRVYLDVPTTQTLTAGARRITVESTASCAIVWNCWDAASGIADIGAGNHVGYLCVERGDVADRAVNVAANADYVSTMTLKCTKGN